MKGFLQRLRLWLTVIDFERLNARRHKAKPRENPFPIRRELRRDIHRRLGRLKAGSDCGHGSWNEVKQNESSHA